MQRVLFHSTIFGPIHSRRLGVSLGVNLSPNDGKTCTFDCLYCEAGYNAQGVGTTGFPSRSDVAALLEAKLLQMRQNHENLNVITFSGNGEPTLHPDFGGIIEDTIRLRDTYFPDVKISVLTNSTRIDRSDVVEALRRIDNNILKLDSAINTTIALLDRPVNPHFTAEQTIELLSQFGQQAIIQTMFTRGDHNGQTIDNTTEAEINALIDAYKCIRPGRIMIYTIDRPTPELSLKKVSIEELNFIAKKIRTATGIDVNVSG